MNKTVINDKECVIVATYHDDDTNKDYIIYTDETKDSEDKLNVYYGTYKVNEENKYIVDPISDDEKPIIDQIIEEIKNKANQ